MTAKAGVTDPYPVSPEGVVEMLLNRDYVMAKYEALQDRQFEVLQLERTDDGHVFKVDREVDANLPDIAKKVLGDTNRLVQSEVWRKSGDGYVADVKIDSPGKPVAITGSFEVMPSGDGAATWTVDFTIKASVPLVGGKIEKIVAQEAQDNLGKEYTFNKQWLAEH